MATKNSWHAYTLSALRRVTLTCHRLRLSPDRVKNNCDNLQQIRKSQWRVSQEGNDKMWWTHNFDTVRLSLPQTTLSTRGRERERAVLRAKHVPAFVIITSVNTTEYDSKTGVKYRQIEN